MSTLGKRKERQDDDSSPQTHGSTLFVSNLPYSATSTDLVTLFSDIAPVRSAFVVLDKASGVSKGVGYVAFSIKEDAQEAFDKASKESISLVGRKLRVQWAGNKPKEGQEVVKKEPKPVARVSKRAGLAPSAASRLIVRNIPFNATEQDLRAAFSPYGPIYSIHIPCETKRRDSGDIKEKSEALQHARTRGFAFVWMSSKKEAQLAIEGCNGMTLRAGLGEGSGPDEHKTKKEQRKEKMKLAKDDGADGDDKRATERVIAVDWALSKDKWQEEKSKVQDEGEDIDMVDGQESSAGGSSENGSNDDSEESNEDEDLGVHRDGRSDSDDEPVKPQLPPPEVGTTLFVRNVPFTATEDEFRVLFRAFGPLRYARITMDAATGRTRGTGFACFWHKEDADKVVDQSELLRVQTIGSEPMPKKNPFTLPSILTPDPSSSLAHNLVLHGRTLDVVRAVTRDQAGKLKEEGEKKREKADNRNMYLLREGVILPNSAAAETLTPAEIEKRTASFNARRTLLRSNPSLYISKTRLSVRQIPVFVTERLLKRLAIHAVRVFESDVKKGLRVGLTEDELAELDEENADDEAVGEGKSVDVKGKRLAGRRTGVKQAKIVRQQERVDPVTGKGRSKGYGFLEMHKHSDALRVLRWANNNPDTDRIFAEWRKDELQDLIKQEKSKETKDEARISRLKEELAKGVINKSKGTLTVEFSIENVQVVQRRSARQTERATKPEEQRSPEKISNADAKTDERITKKRRVSGATIVKAESVRPVRSLIGRKRKERRAKKNAR